MGFTGYSNTKDDQILSRIPLKPFHWNIVFAGMTIILLGWLMWAIHDRFIPIQEGWMQYYSLLTQKGLLPYKDFYYFTQPIPLFITQLISKFGDGYILYRYYGMVERIILVLALYYLISKHFSPTAAFIAVITSAFLYQSFNVDLFYTYYQTTMLFFLLSLICLQREKDSRYPWLYNCFVGIFASLAFFTKQSSGLFVSLFLLFIMVWYEQGKLVLLRLFCFLLGWAIPASFILGWLVKEHIFFEYLSQVYGGISSKGSILDILFGYWGRNSALLYFWLFILILLIMYFLWRIKIVDIKIDSIDTSRFNNVKYSMLFTLPLFFIFGLLLPPDKIISTLISILGYFYLLNWLYFSFYLITIATVIIIIRWGSKKKLPLSIPLAELILASFIWTYSAGLSGELELTTTLLGTALVLAFVIDRIQLSWKHFRLFLTIGSGLVLLICVVTKRQTYYSWWGWAESGHSENVTSIIPAFQDFKLSSETVKIYDRIYLDILENTTSNDYVYTYPHLSLFNYVTDRLQPTFSPVHYFDVCPDNIAIKDAAALLENPPKMIIVMEIPEQAYQFHEEFFRNGQPSGQREIDAAIETIVNKYSYIKIDSFISLGWKWPIYVWLKP